VYLIPADVLICPSFLQVVPGFTAAVAVERLNERTKQPITMVADTRFILPRISTRWQREQSTSRAVEDKSLIPRWF
jgi:hypothetical protein